MCHSENAASGGDALLHRYVVREIGQTSTSTVDACRIRSVSPACIFRRCIYVDFVAYILKCLMIDGCNISFDSEFIIFFVCFWLFL